MSIFNIFEQHKHKEDPYWEFDKSVHYRPKLNKGDFFRLTNYEFGWFVLKPISNFIKDSEGEITKGKSLSYGQKAIYYWWYIDGQVTNGGFIQFYYNGYEKYVPTIIKSLEHIGDKKMAELIQRADNIFQKNKKLIDKAQEKSLFESDLYERLEELSDLDSEYYKLNKKTMIRLEKYIRKNPNEFCLDEEGKQFDMKYSGECKTFHNNTQVKELFNLEKGIITGTFKSFYESGKPKEVIQFLNGEQTGEREEYFENGNKKYTVIKLTDKSQFEHYWYHENGNPEKLEHKLIDKDERIGEYKEWYDNGQLAETETYLSTYERIGKHLEFYKNGKMKSESEYKNGDFLFHNYWLESGEQTIKNGTGVYISDSGWEGHLEHHEHDYKNYKLHGKLYTYLNGVISRYSEMEEGKRNGFTRNYYKNGKLKEETFYKGDEEVSKKEFQMFENPRVEFKIYSRICTECYDEDESLNLPDNEPDIINKVELENMLKADKSQFEQYGDDHIMCYSYTVRVNEQGSVIEIHFSSADNMWIAEDIENSLKKLKYTIALKDNKPTECIYFVQHKFYLTE
jgi:antitoxin component YwqK of YwqJK toxin-antitoxin module